MTGRPTVLTEARLQESLDTLSQYVDSEGICTTRLPTDILWEHYGYKAAQPTYRDVKKLETMGRIATYPPGTKHYSRGFQLFLPEEEPDLIDDLVVFESNRT